MACGRSVPGVSVAKPPVAPISPGKNLWEEGAVYETLACGYHSLTSKLLPYHGWFVSKPGATVRGRRCNDAKHPPTLASP